MLRSICVTMFFVALGCTPNAPHQLGHSPAIGDAGGSVPIYAIEFDDQGAMWDPPQLGKTLEAIRKLGSQHIVVITFIHGWKHDARSEDDNLLAFEEQLGKRKELEQYWAQSMHTAPRPLLGVYVGWRGASLRLDPWITTNLTFWSRKAAATRVGSTALTEAIFSIARVTKDANAESQVVMIGHSFGGAILERAMAQALVGLLNQPGGDHGAQFRPSVDLAVLVNPASPALEAELLVETLMRREVYVRKERASGEQAVGDQYGAPLLVSITATNDWATRYAFPIGQSPISWTKAFASNTSGSPGERELYTHTAGHTPFLLSHTLVATTDAAALTFKTKDGKRYAVTRLDTAWNRSPYWILQAPSDVIDGHNGIFNDSFADLLETILDAGLLSAASGSVRTEVQANPGRLEPVRVPSM